MSLEELKPDNFLKSSYAWHIITGGYPEVISEDINPADWFPYYISTYIERDVRQLKNITNLALFTKLLRMCAGRTGQILNMSSMANDCGIDQKTVASWLGIIQSSYIIYLLKPYYNNFNKRIIKSPKLYFYDTGVACALLSIKSAEEIAIHAAKGALFENMVVGEFLKERFNAGESDNLFYWRDKTGNEVDILVEKAGKLTAIELKAGETISSDYFKGLDYFSGLINVDIEKFLIYGGSQTQIRSNSTIIKSWKP